MCGARSILLDTGGSTGSRRITADRAVDESGVSNGNDCTAVKCGGSVVYDCCVDEMVIRRVKQKPTSSRSHIICNGTSRNHNGSACLGDNRPSEGARDVPGEFGIEELQGSSRIGKDSTACACGVVVGNL